MLGAIQSKSALAHPEILADCHTCHTTASSNLNLTVTVIANKCRSRYPRLNQTPRALMLGPAVTVHPLTLF